MNRSILLATLCAISIFISPDTSFGQKLFKSFNFGDSKSTFTLDGGFYDCGIDIKCKDNEELIGNLGTLGLVFENGKLTSAGLKFKYKDNWKDTLLNKIFASKEWILLSINNKRNGENVDLLELEAKRRSTTIEKANVDRALAEFEQKAINGGEISYTFCTNIDTRSNEPWRSASARELLAIFPNDTRLMVIVVSRDEDYYIVRFSLPN